MFVLLTMFASFAMTVAAQSAWPTELVTLNAAGSASANGGSGVNRISANGRYVLFSSGATDLIPGFHAHAQIFVKDLLTGVVWPVDLNYAGTAGGNGSVTSYNISGNGRYVVFESFASDLTSIPDQNSNGDIFVRDLQTGVTSMVSVNQQSSGSGNAGESYEPQISDDGRFVVFTSYANDLVPNYHPGDHGLFIRDLQNQSTTLVVSGINCNIIFNESPKSSRSRTEDGRCEVTNYRPQISADGHFLAFTTSAILVEEDNDNFSAYLRDLRTGATSLLSVGTSGRTANGTAATTSISPDGRFVLLASDAKDLVPGPLFLGGAFNYFVRDTVTRVNRLVTVSRDGKSDARDSFGQPVIVQDAVMSADGRFVAFVTRATNLTPEKSNDQFEDIFVSDMVAGTTKLVSINAWGTASANRESFRPRISADGRFVVFISKASDLVYDDNNDALDAFGCKDIFVRDIQLGVTTLASINQGGTNSGNQCAFFNGYDISGDGRKVVFTSAASDLVTNDTKSTTDVFLVATPIQFGELQFSEPLFRVNEGDETATITVSRTAGSEGSISVDYATSGGTASSRSHYTTTRGTLHFIPGELSKTFKVLITDDQTANGDKTVSLVLTNPSGGAALGSLSTATLTITDNDATTSNTNSLDESRFYVRQHYLDFLNREPDSAGLQFWTNEIEQCESNALCREVERINISAAFYLSIEFQQTGFLVYRMYQAAYGREPTYSEFIADTQSISQGVVVGAPGWETQLELNKQRFTNAFADRASFKNEYEAKRLADYVKALMVNMGVTVSPLPGDMTFGKDTRATFLRKMAEDPTFTTKESNPAFVLMQYFGYLRRNPNDPPDSDFSGYNFWLNKLNQFNGSYIDAEMVKAFVNSTEYRQRFGP